MTHIMVKIFMGIKMPRVALPPRSKYRFASGLPRIPYYFVLYREAKGWLGLKEYQVRQKKSLERHFVVVSCAYTFILWHKLTGGLRRRWANKLLDTFPQALEAFRTAISYRFVEWLNQNRDVFLAYKASFGFVWA